MMSIIGHRIDYNGVGALRGQRHIPSKNGPKYPPPGVTIHMPQRHWLRDDWHADGHLLSRAVLPAWKKKNLSENRKEDSHHHLKHKKVISGLRCETGVYSLWLIVELVSPVLTSNQAVYLVYFSACLIFSVYPSFITFLFLYHASYLGS